MAIFTHRGPWDSHSRQSKTLRFVEKYFDTIDSLKVESTPSTAFFAPSAVFHDTKGDVYFSGPHIWDWMKRLFKPFDTILHEVVELRVISEGDRDVVYGEFMRHFRLRGDKTEIISPTFVVLTVGPAEEGGGTDGLQAYEVSVFWDTGIVSRYVRSKEDERRRRG